MRSHTVGDEEPEVAVVGGIHGDESCGPTAIQRTIEAIDDVKRPVEFVVANELALDDGVRYVDTDLNRSFPGDAGSDAHEERLAARLSEHLRWKQVLSLHSTVSTSTPFFSVKTVRPEDERIYRRMPVDTLIKISGEIEGTLNEISSAIEVECGLKGVSDTTDRAVEIIEAFLETTGVVGESTRPLTPVDVYRILDSVPKSTSDAEVFAENFERVSPGEKYARIGGEPVVADEAFYPVLMSANGYDEILGYRAERTGRIDD